MPARTSHRLSGAFADLAKGLPGRAGAGHSVGSLPSLAVDPPPPLAHRPRHSLPTRLLWLTVGIVLATQILIFLPGLGRARRSWIATHITQGHIIALSLAGTDPEAADSARRDSLLRLCDAERIELLQPGRPTVVVSMSQPADLPAGRPIDLRTESWLRAAQKAFLGLFDTKEQLIEITGESPLREPGLIRMLIRDQAMLADLRRYAGSVAGLSLVIAGITGMMVYLALLALLVRPMQRITSSIAEFRADPEFTAPIDPTRVTLMPDDEIAVAGRELAAMQRELRAALWRNARLAALGTAVAKVSHDLRGILAPALLTADRLQTHADPAARRAGEIMVTAVQRATELVRRTLDFARDGPPPLALMRIDLASVVDDAAHSATAAVPGFTVDNRIGPGVSLLADHDQLFRVFSNLLRNAAEAGATSASVAQASVSDTFAAVIEISDDGPGLPDAVRAHLFLPFTQGGRTGGTGLGLAIVRDLMRAHGGDIELAATGPEGTTFRLILPAAAARAVTGTAASRTERAKSA